jgi:glycosyltransferase involved in cell wall biosynthesis|tara:strand:- start:159 stop:1007 length:849 start_codon:yes stop_codon:yes gene_type:complete
VEYLGEDKQINQLIPLVSVCVPAFQHEPFIEKCLESILRQETSFDYEICVGEDCSTDRTREICIALADRYPNKIRLFLRDEKEKARRKGKWKGKYNHMALHREARGKYVCICDGDDFWTDPKKLQMQVEVMEKYPDASICITNTLIEGDEKDHIMDLPSNFTIFTPSQLRKKNYMGHISSWMMRNEMHILHQKKVLEKSSYLDMLIFTFYKLRGNTIFIPKVTSCYVNNQRGIFRSASKKKNHLEMYRINWLLFYYLHKDPIHFLRSMLYQLRRYYVNFIKS